MALLDEIKAKAASLKKTIVLCEGEDRRVVEAAARITREGIAKIDNFTIFIPNTIKGERVRIMIVKVLSSHAFGKLIEILKASPVRETEDCQTYKRCGGCNLRHLKYSETLKIKQNSVQSLVNKTLKNQITRQNYN